MTDKLEMTKITAMDLPIADVNVPWDGDGARQRMKEWSTTDEETDWEKYAKGFFWYNLDDPEKLASYKLPFADVIDDKLIAIPHGIFASAAAMQGARGGVDLPSDDREKVLEKINAYYKRMDRETPFEKSDEAMIPVIKELMRTEDGFVMSEGKNTARVLFVSASPSVSEVIRGKPLVGPTGRVFNDSYLKEIGLLRKDVRITHAVPFHLVEDDGKDRSPNLSEFEVWKSWIKKQTKQHEIVVTLGRIAKTLLGDDADFALPHPRALLLFGNSGEVKRKTRSIKRALERKRIAKSVRMDIVKRDNEKQVVLGIVLEPETTDLQGDVVGTDEIEKAAHNFLMSSRVVGDNHNRVAKASVVESYIAQNGGDVDGRKYQAGSWMMAVKVHDDAMWSDIKSGSYTGFSIGGSAERIDE